MSLLSLKYCKPGFLENFWSKNKIQGLQQFTPEKIRVKLLTAVKFVATKDLVTLKLENLDKLAVAGFGFYDGYFQVKKDHGERIKDLWNTYSKLPFDVMTIENSTGIFLLEKTDEGILTTSIHSTGYVTAFPFTILPINKEKESLIQYIVKVPESVLNLSADIKKDLDLMLSVYSIMILNFLLHLNTRNKRVSIYRPSNKYLETFVSKVHRPLFTYHILDIQNQDVVEIKSIAEVVALADYSSPASKRLHMVRGHFKQRTSGLYWWNPFMRGSRENGIVDKDYNVVN